MGSNVCNEVRRTGAGMAVPVNKVGRQLIPFSSHTHSLRQHLLGTDTQRRASECTDGPILTHVTAFFSRQSHGTWLISCLVLKDAHRKLHAGEGKTQRLRHSAQLYAYCVGSWQ